MVESICRLYLDGNQLCSPYPQHLIGFFDVLLLTSPHGIAMPKGLYFNAVDFSFFFSTLNL